MHLLSRINRYLRRSGMTPTRFGREAVNDPNLIKDMRNGRLVRPATERRISAFVDSRESA